MIQESSFFNPVDLENFDRSLIPQHVAIIPDGNRRWAKGNLKDIEEGYQAGADALITIVKAAREFGIKVLTVFAFSTENWSRSQEEVKSIFEVINACLKNNQGMMLDLGIRLNVIGDTAKIPTSLLGQVIETQKATAAVRNLELVLAINYGSRDEIKRAVKKILEECQRGTITLDKISEDEIKAHLDTARWPDPDLIIRTSGEKRISNFLLWQSSYSEIYTEEVTWPNFTPRHLLKAIIDYQKRERRRGGG